MPGDEGTEVTKQQVPTIGGVDGAPSTAPIVSGGHVDNTNRAEGVAYPENFGVDVTTRPYPNGTVMTDSTPNESIN